MRRRWLLLAAGAVPVVALTLGALLVRHRSEAALVAACRRLPAPTGPAAVPVPPPLTGLLLWLQQHPNIPHSMPRNVLLPPDATRLRHLARGFDLDVSPLDSTKWDGNRLAEQPQVDEILAAVLPLATAHQPLWPELSHDAVQLIAWSGMAAALKGDARADAVLPYLEDQAVQAMEAQPWRMDDLCLTTVLEAAALGRLLREAQGRPDPAPQTGAAIRRRCDRVLRSRFHQVVMMPVLQGQIHWELHPPLAWHWMPSVPEWLWGPRELADALDSWTPGLEDPWTALLHAQALRPALREAAARTPSSPGRLERELWEALGLASDAAGYPTARELRWWIVERLLSTASDDIQTEFALHLLEVGRALVAEQHRTGALPATEEAVRALVGTEAWDPHPPQLPLQYRRLSPTTFALLLPRSGAQAPGSPFTIIQTRMPRSAVPTTVGIVVDVVGLAAPAPWRDPEPGASGSATR